jgi:hypothetical protein
MEALKFALHFLAIVTSLGCTLLLVRGYRRDRHRMLLWCAICFAFLTVNNLLLFVDLIVLPSFDLRFWRVITALAGVSCMLYAFIWELGRGEEEA